MLNSPLGGRRGIGFGLGRSWQRGGFSPTDIAGLQLWFDFSDASTLFTDAGVTSVSADGDAIYQANDKSGNNHHITQATLGYRPLYKTGIQNGLSSSYWDGADDRLIRNSFSLSQPFTSFVVVKHLLANDACIYYDSYNTVQCTNYIASGNMFLACGSSIHFSFTSTNTALSTGIANGASSKLQINDSTFTEGSVGTNGFNGISVGNVRGNPNPVAGGYSMYGYIMEEIIYSSVLSDTDLASVKSYLNNKWAIY